MSVANFVLLFLLSLFSCGLSQAAKKMSPTHLIELNKVAPLAEKQGYLLVDLNVNGIAPSFTLSKIKGQNSSYIEKSIDRLKLTHSQKVDLKGKKKGLYLLPLSSGLYQITRINAPFFDLPFRLNTDNRRNWRFSIEAGKLNYIGKLFIDKERSVSGVMVRLYNRIATDHEKLLAEIKKINIQYPLASAAGVRDDFYVEYLSSPHFTDVIKNSSSSDDNKEFFK